MLIGLSLFCFAAAVWRHLNPGPPPPVPDVQRLPGAALIALNVEPARARGADRALDRAT